MTDDRSLPWRRHKLHVGKEKPNTMNRLYEKAGYRLSVICHPQSQLVLNICNPA